jgi:glycosyltransferase involved in cell wall biosynthesis
LIHGIDAAAYRPSAERRRVARERLGIGHGTLAVGYVGRLTPSKALEDLLQASRELARDLPDASVVIEGDGPSRAALEALTAQWQLGATVRFIGYRTDVPDVLAALDVFVFPSLHEGHPNAVLEAIAAGVPVVATAIPGNDELVEDGGTGYLVPVRDAAALVDRVRRLARDPEARAAMGARAREIVAGECQMDGIVRRFESLYERALAGGALHA